ncbi:ribonuclease H-like domain-containing protein [Tanacetum coccineum]
MNQFYDMKGIKREFSVARTPLQNGVAERKNRTLIEAARTMLVDSKLPTTFWAEAVNTACYVLNRALVIKPHNKTPYELIRGRPPLIDFMKPFGCPVTILNTRDNLGKFDGKANEGFFWIFYDYTPVSTTGPSFDNAVSSPLVNTDGPSVIPNVSSMDNTGIFGNAYDDEDVKGGVDMNNVNGVAERRNRKLIEAARTMLVDSKLPTTFWAKAVNTACYDSEKDARMKPTEVDESRASDKNGKDAQDTRSESERLIQKEMQTEHTNSTNIINTVSTPVSIVGPSFDNVVPSPPVNTAGPSVSTANAFEEHLFV